MMDALEFNCPLCSRPLVLETRAPESPWANPYATVRFECRDDRGGECGWNGRLLLSEGVAVAGLDRAA